MGCENITRTSLKVTTILFFCFDFYTILRAEERESPRGGLIKTFNQEESEMAEKKESVYKIIELVGTSTKSWEDAAKNAVERAARTLRELRIAEVAMLDMKIENGKVVAYRARVKVSFKYLGED